MTKEEIEEALWDKFRMQDFTPSMSNALVLFVKEQLDQETQRLKAELAEKDKEIYELRETNSWQGDKLRTYKGHFEQVEKELTDRDNANRKLQKDYYTEICKLQSELTAQQELNKTLLESSSFVNNALVEIQSELTELKEKHKWDVNDFLETLHFHGYIDHDITKLKDLTEQYYNKTHKTK